ncbi:MAG: DinB family protein [Desulfobacterales bacterium]|nr:DinB family protein [Desulfobacterales bacterium]
MTDRRTEIIAKLENNLKHSTSFFRSLSDDQLSVQLYTDGAKWTVKQILAHFITIERSMHWLFKDILSGGSGSPDDFDLDRFNLTQPKKLGGLTVEELIEQFKSVREDTIVIVRGMTEQDLNREGMHAFHGHGKLERFIIWAYKHVRIHEDDIRKVLRIK